MSAQIHASYEAYWDCPSCGERTSDCDEGVDDDGEEIHIICSWEVDKGGDALVACGHEYSVRK
ncbi:hypothetical protein V6259_12715 [Marinomonas sp. TI.3.20]|uniref:hypothetical protein n=1 Tax=Marinomonas sp. TI.3.20 TaxID=3121296 RepID=UPI00311DE864